MYNEKTIAAVIPAYNEEAFIGEVIATLPPFIDRAYVVDDGSTDDTWSEIRAIAASIESDGVGSKASAADGGNGVRAAVSSDVSATVVPIRHATNRGVGAAIKTGYQRSIADGMDVTVVIAGDGQTVPDVVERILEPVATGRADYAKGNRLLLEGRGDMPLFRQVGNFTLSLLTKIASGYWKVMDPQNGSTAISREALERLDIGELYEGYGFTNDLLTRLNAHDMRVADVSRRAVYGDETSDIVYSSFVPATSRLLLRNFLWRLRVKYLVRDFHPLALFYFFGAAVAGAGALGWLRARLGGESGRNGSPAVLFALGWLSMLFAMVFDMRENEHLQTIQYDVDTVRPGAGTDLDRRSE